MVILLGTFLVHWERRELENGEVGALQAGELAELSIAN